MNSDRETGFGPGSAARHLCALGQIAAFLPRHPHLHKEEFEGWSLRSLLLQMLGFCGSRKQPWLTVSKRWLHCYLATYIQVIPAPFPAPSLEFGCPDTWRDCSSPMHTSSFLWIPFLHHPLKVRGPESLALAYALEDLSCFLHFTFHLAASPRLVSVQPSPWSLLLNTESHWASSPTCAPGFNAFALWHSSFIHSISFYYPSFTSATSRCQCACVSCHLDNVQRPLTPPPSFSLPTALRYPQAARVHPTAQIWSRRSLLEAFQCPSGALRLQPTFLSIASRILQELAPALFSTSYSQKGVRLQTLCHVGAHAVLPRWHALCFLCFCTSSDCLPPLPST